MEEEWPTQISVDTPLLQPDKITSVTYLQVFMCINIPVHRDTHTFTHVYILDTKI